MQQLTPDESGEIADEAFSGCEALAYGNPDIILDHWSRISRLRPTPHAPTPHAPCAMLYFVPIPMLAGC